MTVNKRVISKIKKNSALKARLCAVFDKHFGTIERWINMNSSNGPLTTTLAVQVIKEQMGLTEDEILETSKAVV
jgi:hypothetical protein